jgi:hypothetical protein
MVISVMVVRAWATIWLALSCWSVFCVDIGSCPFLLALTGRRAIESNDTRGMHAAFCRGCDTLYAVREGRTAARHLNAMMACAPLCQLVLSRHPGPIWSRRQEAVRRLPYPECRCKNSKVVWLNSSTFSYSGVWAHPSKITNSACWMFCFIGSAKRVEVTRS